MKRPMARWWQSLFHKSERDRLQSLRTLFEKFHEILDLNNAVLNLIADMGEKLSGDYVFDAHYIESAVEELNDLMYRIIYNLNSITDNRNLALYDAFERIRKRILEELSPTPTRAGELVLPLDRVTRDLEDLVGKKMSSLGEIALRLGGHVPPGFVLTTHAYRRFMDQAEVRDFLEETFDALKRGLSPEEASERICKVLTQAKVPQEVERALQPHLAALREAGHRWFAVRSSALLEDSELSFAGQYRSFLQVAPDQILARYKDVVSSLFSPEVIEYRNRHGLSHLDTAMAVGVLAMAPSRVSGVLYTRDPEMPDSNVILISAAWGLARTVVEGRGQADFYKLSRAHPAGASRLLESRVAEKTTQWLGQGEGGEKEVPVPAELRNVPCLSESDIEKLADIGDRLEMLFRRPQDIEWTMDESGAIHILQSRDLRIRTQERIAPEAVAEAARARPRIMENAGMVACRGIGAGKVVHVLEDADFARFPKGAVLVAKSTSPKLSRLIPLASAVVTDIGTPTGHMATIAREYRVPTLVDTGRATQLLAEGTEVTVDAEERVIYSGIVKELLQFQATEEHPFPDAREFRVLRRVLHQVSPLYLTDPESREFTPENCRTYHDITRYSHEIAVRQFIEFHLRGSKWKRVPMFRLSLPVPLGLVVIDLGGGIAPDTHGRVLTPDAIASRPMKALLIGLCAEGVWKTNPVDLDFRSFMASLTRTAHTASMNPHRTQNLAVLSNEYMNLNLRVGYHFNMIDAILTENRNDNYIYFRFLGGVTEMTRRTRRARFLGEVLNHYDFVVELKGDLVVGRIKKISRPMMEDRLAMLGRLIGYSRQLDVLMRSEEAVDTFVREFVLSRHSGPPPRPKED